MPYGMNRPGQETKAIPAQKGTKAIPLIPVYEIKVIPLIPAQEATKAIPLIPAQAGIQIEAA